MKKDIYEIELKKLIEEKNFRKLKYLNERDGKYVFYKGNKLLNLSSNDYLSLATDKDLLLDFYKDIKTNVNYYSLGSSSSRLLTGNYYYFKELEDTISSSYNKYSKIHKSSLVFNSGYHANIGIIPSMLKKGDLILSDKLNHASIIDGIKLSNVDFYRFKHLDYTHLEDLLKSKSSKYNKVLIISESVFSMDGDIADIEILVKLKEKYETLLYIDEAHAIGVFGDSGLGICQKEYLLDKVDIIVGTFGKALASTGAFVVSTQNIINYLTNKMRSFIYTTALPPVTINWNKFIFEQLDKFTEKKNKLLKLSKMFRRKLNHFNLQTVGDSQIIPIILGDNKKCVNISKNLIEKGFLIFPIRPPTVPVNTSRLRISLNSNIEWDDIKNIPNLIFNSL